MFTGIVETVGKLVTVGKRLEIAATLKRHPNAGDSVSVDGCCLTHLGGETLAFDLSDETLMRTRFGEMHVGDSVNLESALIAGDPLGGHFVLGHVDAVTDFIGSKPGDVGAEFRFHTPTAGARLIADKGCVTINGVSLTVVNPSDSEFSVWLVPHTLQHTNLGALVPGEKANVEFDVLARYVARLIEGHPESGPLVS